MIRTVAVGLAAFALACGGSKGPEPTAGYSEGTGESGGSGASGATSVEASSSSDGFETGLDTMPPGDIPMGCGDGGMIEFSHVWVANHLENTVSKINTQTLQEEGRYIVHPDALNPDYGDPSRTSVNLNGDMVVANRCRIKTGGPGCSGVTKIAGKIEHCIDSDNSGSIETSTGPTNVLPWGEDECVLWHRPFDAGSNRPVAWTSGTPSPDNSCEWVNPEVWTATSDNADPSMAHVYRLSGADGSIAEQIDIPSFNGGELAVYGGAVDSMNGFWFVGGYGWVLGHVAMGATTAQLVPMPSTPYGIIVDDQDRVWTAGGQVNRWDPVAMVWDSVPCELNSCDTLAQDDDGWIWVTEGNRIHQIDPNMMAITRTIRDTEIPVASIKGIAFDIEGYMWVVTQGTSLYKIDPTTPATLQTFTNSSVMYTYSDFTGFGLYNVANPVG